MDRERRKLWIKALVGMVIFDWLVMIPLFWWVDNLIK